MPIVVIGYVLVYLVVGNMIADTGDARPRDEQGFSCGVRSCYDRLAIKPWPFRSSRYYQCPKEGDKNRCTGEVYNGKWWYKPLVQSDSLPAGPGVRP